MLDSFFGSQPILKPRSDPARRPTRPRSNRPESGAAQPAADSLAAAFCVAARVLAEVLAGRNLNEALAQCWRQQPDLSAASRGAIQDLCYGTLRRHHLGDALLSRLMSKAPEHVELRAILLMALYRLDARPEDGHTTVNQAVEAAGSLKRGIWRGLTNGVLRNYLRHHEALAEEVRASHPDSLWQHPVWWIDRLCQAYPQDWQAILAAGNGHPPMALRVNRRLTSPEAALAELAAAGIDARLLSNGGLLLTKPQGVDKLPGFFSGRLSVQDAGAQQAAPLLDLAPGMRVLDACSAPGGKTAHMLELADVALTALDSDAQRLERVRENLNRLGLAADTVAADCRRPQAWWDGQPFQRILADVPCSASGVVRRHPDIKWLRRNADIAGFARTQAEILDALWSVLAADGKLLYATCSVFPEENQEQVAAFVARHGDCRLLQPHLQLLPNAEHDGFFYALLQKSPNA